MLLLCSRYAINHRKSNILLWEEIQKSVNRILQEQLNNIFKFAHANQVTIKVKKQAGFVKLLVADGEGFDMHAIRTEI